MTISQKWIVFHAPEMSKDGIFVTASTIHKENIFFAFLWVEELFQVWNVCSESLVCIPHSFVQ